MMVLEARTRGGRGWAVLEFIEVGGDPLDVLNSLLHDLVVLGLHARDTAAFDFADDRVHALLKLFRLFVGQAGSFLGDGLVDGLVKLMRRLLSVLLLHRFLHQAVDQLFDFTGARNGSLRRRRLKGRGWLARACGGRCGLALERLDLVLHGLDCLLDLLGRLCVLVLRAHLFDRLFDFAIGLGLRTLLFPRRELLTVLAFMAVRGRGRWLLFQRAVFLLQLADFLLALGDLLFERANRRRLN